MTDRRRRHCRRRERPGHAPSLARIAALMAAAFASLPATSRAAPAPAASTAVSSSRQAAGKVTAMSPIPHASKSGTAGLMERTPQVVVSRSRQASGTEALLQAVSAVDTAVVWVSGHAGTVLRTLDGGRHWQPRPIPGTDTLQFRDVDAFDADTAWVLSAGAGPLSRIYRTIDGGSHWTLQFQNEDPRAFFDCLAFWDSRHGLAFSDAVAGRFLVLRTIDGGERWEAVPVESLPPARAGEASFAASGTCVATGAGGRAWIGLGGVRPARVLHTASGGRRWSASETPIDGGPTAGLTSVAFWDTARGIAFGGDVAALEDDGDHVTVTMDGGHSWAVAGRTRLHGPIYGGAVFSADGAFAVGPGGADVSLDGGASWRAADDAAYWSVAFASAAEVGWAVGPEGRITRFSVRRSGARERSAPSRNDTEETAPDSVSGSVAPSRSP